MSRWLALAALALLTFAGWAAQPAGMVKVVKGSVSIDGAGGKRGAVPGDIVEVGDTIVTGGDGQVGVALKDNTLLSAGPNSTLVLEDFAFDATTHAGVLDARVKRGTLAVVSGKIVKNSPATVRFRTPNSMLGVRGTSFVIDVGAGEP
ncbi:MAG: hypothetical protein EHM59_22585 [Betaproteobacteria bacterium]|nr:MAG: hypothetical protein EHM59_22585 [Betaproteobacteria bacterium]